MRTDANPPSAAFRRASVAFRPASAPSATRAILPLPGNISTLMAISPGGLEGRRRILYYCTLPQRLVQAGFNTTVKRGGYLVAVSGTRSLEN